MKWQQVTAVYVIGNPHPLATFANEAHAVTWGEQQYPGEWIKKAVKIPHLPLSPKSATKNLKNVAALLDRLDWEDDEEGDRSPDQVIRPD